MWHLGTWFSGGVGSARLAVGLGDLKGLFQPKQFYDSMVTDAILTRSTPVYFLFAKNFSL